MVTVISWLRGEYTGPYLQGFFLALKQYQAVLLGLEAVKYEALRLLFCSLV